MAYATIDYTVVDNWGTGFNAGVKFQNTSGAALNGWTLEFDLAADITHIWNAELLSRAGTRYVIRNAAWNGTVANGQTIDFGFLGAPTAPGPVAEPATFLLNGHTIAEAPTDVPPALTVADVVLAEGDAGTTNAVFTVTLSKAAAGAVTVQYATADGTGVAGSDYDARTGTLTFQPGETTKTVSVPVRGDTLVEADERFALVLSAPAGATLADDRGEALIRNDDATPALPSLALGDATVIEGDKGSTVARFSVVLSGASAVPVTVVVATADGTAKAGADYVARTATLTFNPGETVKAFDVSVLGDRAAEGTEAFQVRLSGAKGAAIADGLGAGTILDNDVVPDLRTSDVRLVEGDAGTTDAVFTVALSQASGRTVTVGYATADGTAKAGSDYTAATGTLTFNPGETAKTVSVAVTGDLAAEADEAFLLRLAKPVNARIADGEGVATVVNDDAAAVLPRIGISSVQVAEGNPRPAAGFFSTRGSQIVDAAGNPVKIAGVNWFGMESGTHAPHGLWVRGYKEMMDQMDGLGFNTIRLTYCNEMFDPGRIPNGIDFSKNPDLQGLTGLQIMDRIVDYAGQLGLRIILDHHRSAAGVGFENGGLWYTDQYPESRWIADWQMLADRYKGNPTVIGADLHNEPHGPATWGTGGPTDWEDAAERAGNAILAKNPDWLIFVEGIGTYNGEGYWWGGNLMGVRDDPVTLDVPNKVVYSPHDYPNSIYPQSWFQGSGFPDNLPAKFSQMWGYIHEQDIAPVMLGEFGSRLIDPKDLLWLDKITRYLAGDYDVNGTNDLEPGELGMGWTWWSWNPNSGDTGGILADDWTTVLTDKVDALKPLMFAMPEPGTGGSTPSIGQANVTVTLSQAATGPVAVDYATVDGTAVAGLDYAATSGRLVFQAGETAKTISVPVYGDGTQEGNELFHIRLANASGGTLPTTGGLATVTILDDDPSAMLMAAAVGPEGG